ncbi:protein kinase [Streptomyces sp. NPDC060194]|uniref:serine/threonine-protein kinase n=1 Tax=Streptomyces sp. NPDC060194 TaxID=3347069 RepID=UPI003656BFD5
MGEVFAGRYELADPIGRGGAGAVWRAWDHRRKRYVAAKVLLQSDAHTLLRFVREQALRIDHPHVLAPASWAADDDKVLFTMDLVSGGSLAHLIGDYGPLPPRFVCTLLDQLLAGLATVHAEGVVHRDIKPANILLEATGTGRPHLRLSDFGISMRKGEPRLTETDFVIGTPGYFAPEQMLGAEPDFPADLFAVGLVALYLLQGAKPDSQALVEQFAAHGTPAAPEGVPEPLWQVVANLLQPDPHARFRTAVGARKALAAAVEMLPEADPADDPVEVFDQLGPLPPGFGPSGPAGASAGGGRAEPRGDQGPHGPQGGQEQPGRTGAATTGHEPSETGSFHLAPPPQRLAPDRPSAPPVPTAGHTPPRYTPPAATTPDATPPGYGHPLHQATAPTQPGAHPGPLPGHAPSLAPYGVQTSAVREESPFTKSYTAQPAGVPSPAAGSGTARRRPGPPAKVAVPVLLLALVCYAIGIWALTQA